MADTLYPRGDVRQPLLFESLELLVLGNRLALERASLRRTGDALCLPLGDSEQDVAATSVRERRQVGCELALVAVRLARKLSLVVQLRPLGDGVPHELLDRVLGDLLERDRDHAPRRRPARQRVNLVGSAA